MGRVERDVLREAELQVNQLEMDLFVKQRAEKQQDTEPDEDLRAFARSGLRIDPRDHELVITTTIEMLDGLSALTKDKARVGRSARKTLARADHLAGRLYYLRATLCPIGAIEDYVDLAEAVVRLTWQEAPEDHLPTGLAALVGPLPSRSDQQELAFTLVRMLFQDGRAVIAEAAVLLYEQVTAALPPDDPSRPGALTNHATALVNRFRRGSGSIVDLDRALTLHREALTLLAEDDPQRGSVHSNIGSVLRDRFQQLDRPTDLDDAIAELRLAAAIEHADRPIALSNLSDALRQRYERTHDAQDIVDAVSAGRRAVDTTPRTHRNRAPAVFHLALALVAAEPSRTAVSEAVRLAEEAVEVGGPHHVQHNAFLILRDGLREPLAQTAKPPPRRRR